MGIVGLAPLFAGARADTHPIAFHKGETITLARWRADVAHNTERLLAGRIRRGDTEPLRPEVVRDFARSAQFRASRRDDGRMVTGEPKVVAERLLEMVPG